MHRGLPFTSTYTLCIQELFDRRSRRPTSTNGCVAAAVEAVAQTGDVGEQQLRGEGDHAVGVRSTSGSRGSSGTEVDAVRAGRAARRA